MRNVQALNDEGKVAGLLVVSRQESDLRNTRPGLLQSEQLSTLQFRTQSIGRMFDAAHTGIKLLKGLVGDQAEERGTKLAGIE